MPTYVPQPDDIPLTATLAVLGGSCGQIPKTHSMEVNIRIIALPNSKQNQHITHDVACRVWKLDKRFNHVPLQILAHMAQQDRLGDAEATYQEIILVAAH